MTRRRHSGPVWAGTTNVRANGSAASIDINDALALALADSARATVSIARTGLRSAPPDQVYRWRVRLAFAQLIHRTYLADVVGSDHDVNVLFERLDSTGGNHG